MIDDSNSDARMPLLNRDISLVNTETENYQMYLEYKPIVMSPMRRASEHTTAPLAILKLLINETRYGREREITSGVSPS